MTSGRNFAARQNFHPCFLAQARLLLRWGERVFHMWIPGLSQRIARLAALWREATPRLSQEEISRAIGIARVFLLTSLIFVHYDHFPNSPTSPKDGFDPGLHPVATFFNSFVFSLVLGLIPLLSAISGWLFFTFKEPGWAPLKRRIGSRFRSLYLFLVFWNVLFLALLYTLFRIDPENPLSAIYAHFAHFGTWDYVNAVFGITDWPIDFPFWFVRDLFLAVLLSPLLSLLLRKAPLWGAAGLTVIWLGNMTFGIFFRADILAFFYFGGLLRTLNAPLEVSRRATFVLAGIALGFAVLRALTPLYLPPALSYDHFPLSVVMRIFRLVAVVACWGLFIQAARTVWGARLAPLSGVAVFIYATHAVVLDTMKLLLWPLMPGESDLWMLVHYALSVGATLAIVLTTGMVLQRRTPRLFAFLTGGRASGTRERLPARPAPAPAAIATPR
jgi:hypothetical protein